MSEPRTPADLDVMTNQTTFAEESPIFESDRPQHSEVTPSSPRKKLIISGVVGLLVLVIVVAVAALLMPKQQVAQVDQGGLKYTPKPVAKTELRLRVEELQTNLEQADPVKVDLPLPPVSMDLSLDPPRR